MGKAIRILLTTLLTLWVVTAFGYRLWQRHTARLAAADRAAQRAAAPHFATPAKLDRTADEPGPGYDPHELAGLACGRTVISRNGALTCPVCPQGSDDGPVAGEEPQPDAGGGWTYDSLLPGHFTAPAANEILLHVTGCESPPSNLGGDFLLRNTAGTWSVVRYVHAGIGRAGCQTLPWPGGGEAAVCTSTAMNQGIVSESLVLTRYGAEPPAGAPGGEHAVFLMLSDESATCDPANTTGDDPVEVATLKRWTLLPPGPAGRRDLELVAEVEQRHRQAAGDGCKPGPVQRIVMRFRNMGDHFEATEGFAAMKALQAKTDRTLAAQIRPDIY